MVITWQSPWAPPSSCSSGSFQGLPPSPSCAFQPFLDSDISKNAIFILKIWSVILWMFISHKNLPWALSVSEWGMVFNCRPITTLHSFPFTNTINNLLTSGGFQWIKRCPFFQCAWRCSSPQVESRTGWTQCPTEGGKVGIVTDLHGWGAAAGHCCHLPGMQGLGWTSRWHGNQILE